MAGNVTIQEVIQFLDEDKGQTTGFASVMDPVETNDDTPVNNDLGDFLKRPVKIATFTWAESDAVGTSHTYSPWHLFFNDAKIKYKTNNYSFIQCDLKVKVMINASPFYYGALLMSYEPLPNFSAGSYASITNDTGTRYFIPYSQRPHLWIYPTTSAGGEMTLPFFVHKNWLRLQVAQDFTDMGELTFLNYTALASANGATGVGVTVQVYAWAENVRIAGPSMGLSMQVRDEYCGPVSGPASAVAAAAGILKKIPLISSFATAAEMGAKVVAYGANLLGFTNTPVISDVQPFKPTAIAPMASSEISYPVEKLTIDPKNELTIDPAVAGLSPVDELSITHLVQRESYLCTASWATSNAADDILFSSAIGPTMFDNDNATNSKVYMTPMCWMSYNFAHWRGDIIFRFRFIASPYHKGRVRIIYDPTGYAAENIISDVASNTAVFNQIVDLGKDTDVEIRVPYQQAYAWLANPGYPLLANQLWSISASPTYLHDDEYTNGTIVMRVLNALTAPVASSTVKVLVFVRGADNLEFANPVNAFSDLSTKVYSYLAPQSSDEEYDQAERQRLVAGAVVHSPAPQRYLVNWGEAIMSLRQLMRRSSLVSCRSTYTDTTHLEVLYQRFMSRWPTSPGYDTNGVDTAKGVITTGSNFAYNFCELHPIQYVAPAFIGTRGSVIWHFNVANPDVVTSIRVYRSPLINTVAAENVTTLATGSTASAIARYYTHYCNGGSGGQAVTNQRTQVGLSVSLPNYCRYKFQSTSPLNSTALQELDGTRKDAHTLEIMQNGTFGAAPGSTRVWSYASIGSDYTLHFFLNVPTMWIYSAYPTAN